MSAHGKKLTKRRVLTPWIPRREGLVRTQKEGNRVTGTHKLETAEGRTCQDMERNQPSDGHSLPGGHRGRELSGSGVSVTERGAHILGTAEGGTRQDTKESNQASGTHSLDTAKGKASQDMKRMCESTEKAIIEMSAWNMD